MTTPTLLFGALSVLLAGGLSTTGAAVPAAAERADPPKPRLVTFIGEQLSVEKLPCTVPNGRTRNRHGVDASGCTEDDYVYLARYRVVEALHGEVAGIVEFESASFRLDEYAASHFAVLYVAITPTRTWGVTELAEAVYPTTGGGWAACESRRGYPDDLLGPINLAGDPSFGDIRWMSPRGIEHKFPRATYAIVDGRARCRRGLELPELLEMLESRLERGRERKDWVDEENAPPDP